MTTSRTAPTHRRWAPRIAGSLLAIVGAANAALGAWSLTAGGPEFTTGVAGGLVFAGLVTLAAGVLVWRGSRLTRLVALTIFGVLLLAQLTGLVGGAQVVGEDLGRIAVLVVLVVALALAGVREGDRHRH